VADLVSTRKKSIFGLIEGFKILRYYFASMDHDGGLEMAKRSGVLFSYYDLAIQKIFLSAKHYGRKLKPCPIK